MSHQTGWNTPPVRRPDPDGTQASAALPPAAPAEAEVEAGPLDETSAGEHADAGAPGAADAPDTDSPTRALLLVPPRLDADTRQVDLAIQAWLHAKFQRSQSRQTRRAYTSILQAFRTDLLMEGLDLDGADPRRCRADLLRLHRRHTGASRPDWKDLADDAVERRAAEVPAAVLEDVTAARTTAIALAAQAFAARPAQTAYGPRPVEPTTANLRLAVLSSFYTYALRHDLLRGPNPVERVERRHVQDYASARPLSYDDLHEHLAALDLRTDAGLRDYALLLVALSTGRRVAELAGMRREHLTIHKRSAEIEWPRCKGGQAPA